MRIHQSFPSPPKKSETCVLNASTWCDGNGDSFLEQQNSRGGSPQHTAKVKHWAIISLGSKLDVLFLKEITGLVVEPTHLKNMIVKLDHFPNCRGQNKKYLKPFVTICRTIPRERSSAAFFAQALVAHHQSSKNTGSSVIARSPGLAT